MLVNFITPKVRYNEFFGLKSNVNRLFDEFFETDRIPGRYSSSALRGSLEEKGDELVFKAEIPGIDKNELKVSVLEDIVTVSVDKKQHQAPEEAKWVKNERLYGTFSRSFKLPYKVDQSKISAELKDGVLTLNFTKSAEAKPKVIEVK